jgi:two-component system cell cycle sensor histidine kinase/response regulator CckA
LASPNPPSTHIADRTALSSDPVLVLLRRATWAAALILAAMVVSVVMLLATVADKRLSLSLLLAELVSLAVLLTFVRTRLAGEALLLRGQREEISRQTWRLDQHTLELRDQAAQLQAQAVALEHQAAEAQSMSEELENANQCLASALSDAEQARQAAEGAARERQELLQLFDVLLSRASIGFALLDDQFRFLSINKTLASMNGFPVAEHLGRGVFDLIPAEIAPKLKEVLDEVLETGRPVLGLELTAAAADDATRARHGIANYYPIRGEGRPTVIGVVVEDTTARKELELQLAQSQKMEAVGRLAGGVAHDFNNLLTVIKSYSRILLDALDGDSRREDVEEIAAAADRAAALTRQLLAFSRRQMMQPRALRLNAVVTDIEKMLRRLIGEDIVLVTRLDPALSLVNADPGQIEQVLMNLAVNARDAMPDGGRLTIETSNVRVDDSSFVELAVSDTGIGMTSEVRSHLFEPFFTTKERGKGTGLGLSTVYGIVKQSGGDISVQAEPGKGSTFKILLPRLAGEVGASTSPERTTPAAPRGSETILLVEDDASLRALAERILRGYGYTVLVASAGQRALALVADYPRSIDLVLTDVVMPEMSGTTLVERLRPLRPTLRVLFMSGYTDDEVVRRGVLDRWAAFLQKPFTPDQLAFKVREVLDHEERLVH